MLLRKTWFSGGEHWGVSDRSRASHYGRSRVEGQVNEQSQQNTLIAPFRNIEEKNVPAACTRERKLQNSDSSTRNYISGV